MRRNGYMDKTTWNEVEVEVTIDVDDVVEFIDEHATNLDLEQIRKTLNTTSLPSTTMVGVMKIDLFKVAAEKYTLEQLEEMLDIKYY